MFRLYALPSCPHCHEAISYLCEKGMPFQCVMPPDPIILEGIFQTVGAREFPVLYSFLGSGAIAKGFKRETYDELYRQYTVALAGTGAPNATAADGQHTGQAANMANEA